jgi:hypothetical protein
VAGGQRGHAHGVHVVLNRLAGAFFGGLEQRAHVHVKAQVGKGGGHHLGAAVVAVLAQLADHHAGAAALRFGKALISVLSCFPALGTVISGCVHTGHLLRIGAVAPKTFSSASLTSPTVARRRMALMDRSSRLP